jgi:hypothetical protein
LITAGVFVVFKRSNSSVAADAEEKVEVAKKEKKVVADAPAKKRKSTNACPLLYNSKVILITK